MIPRFKPWLGWPEFVALFGSNKGAVERFEQEFAKVFEAVDAVAFPYGRSAQWAFFKAVGIENAEVIMSAYTCSVVAHAVTLSGNRPRFVDIKLDDYNMDLDLVPPVINESTRAIIAPHTFGYPQDLDRLEAIVKEGEARYGHKIWLIQDCAHAFGASWKGRTIGTSGDAALYAFNISKMITSIFGGILTFQDRELAERIRVWRNKNYRKAGLLKALKRRLYLLAAYIAFIEKVYSLTWWLQERTSLLDRLTKSYHLDDKVHFPPDYLDHMLDVEAAVGLAQLKKYPAIIERRRAQAAWYGEYMERQEGWVSPPLVEGATYSHYVIRVPNRATVVKEMAKKGVHVGELIQYTLPSLPSYRASSVECPICLEVSKTIINYPLIVQHLSGKD
jgi:perosamine synthetase